MQLLVLGGTHFVGRHLVEAALGAGHEVTLFNRGRTHPGLFRGVEEVRGDRDGGLGPLAGRRFDAAIDVNGYVPRVVADAAGLLRDSVERYMFISTGAVYARPVKLHYDESSPVQTIPDETSEDVDTHYGALKRLCERRVEEAFPGRSLVLRLGLVCGPHDPTDRVTWWLARAAAGGRMLAPGAPGHPIQVVDARDLGAFAMRALARGLTGVLNATGRSFTWLDWLTLFRAAGNADTTFHWIDDRGFLSTHLPAAPRPGGALPLFFPEAWGPWWTASSDRAQALGLTYRPMAETAADLLAWHRARPADHVWEAGLEPGVEAAILDAWDARR
jgi:2'-hydroxyisoflavone reductase